MTDVTALTNEQLLAEYERLWRASMYYMAAEGSWESERADREATNKEFDVVEKEVRARGLT